MATGKVVVNVVDVGQGQCTFVEIYDTSSTPKLIHALLFDCGSDKLSDETYANLKYIADSVSTMTTPAFDCIFFSHSDKDHISLTRYLLGESAMDGYPIITWTTKPVIKQVWFGGARIKYTKGKKKFNLLNYMVAQTYCALSDQKEPYSNYTGYDKTTKNYVKYFWKSTDSSVYVYPIAANALSSDPDWDDDDKDLPLQGAEFLNRVSMVCGLYYAGASYVICGDATNVTMAAIDQLFSAGTAVFNNNKMTTLPHHGSRATGLAVPSSSMASSSAIKVVDTFSGLMKSRTVTASSYQKHKHTSLELIAHFPPVLTTPALQDTRFVEANVHSMVLYVDTQIKVKKLLRTDEYYSLNTFANLFGTNYSMGSSAFSASMDQLITGKASAAQGVKPGQTIDPFACWVYTASSTGSTILEGRANLSTAAFTGAPTVSSSSPSTSAAAMSTTLTTLEDVEAYERSSAMLNLLEIVPQRITITPRQAVAAVITPRQFGGRLNVIRQ